jgi:protoporphyrinogen oxidase
MKTFILGGGLAGLSCSYHLGHENCQIIERNSYLGGHAATHQRDGAFWDEGPHVSFSKNIDAKQLLTWSSGGDLLEYPTDVGNYFQGHWIPHPAQSNLYAVPQPLARKCLDDFQGEAGFAADHELPRNYQEWLDQAFGKTFSRTFPHAYTRKYWTCEPAALATDWVGSRVFKPDLSTVLSGYEGKPVGNTHYISSVRYPAFGGFATFSKGISLGAQVRHDEVVSIDLRSRNVHLASGATFAYDSLINTIPLDKFVSLIEGAPKEVVEAANCLRCTSLLLVNILGVQTKSIPYHWLYVYDEDKYSTRITQTHLLSPSNTPKGIAGIQVEVYASPYRPFAESHAAIAERVANEVRAMSLIDEIEAMHFNFIPYANIIFDHQRIRAQETILTFLTGYGLVREADDLDPMTDWENATTFDELPRLALAGRFGQWKYFWSDDCILRGSQLINHQLL